MPAFLVLLFDLYDTLCRVDQEVYLRGKERTARLLGLDRDHFLEVWRSSGDLSSCGAFADTASRARHVLESLGRRPSHLLCEHLARLEEEHLLSACSLYPDAAEVLRHLVERGWRLGLVSNASPTAVRVVHHLELAAFFEKMTFSFAVGVMKPAAAIYQTACQGLAVRPEACLFIGDGANQELLGARKLGMTTVRVDHPHRFELFRTQVANEADHLIHSLPELLSLLP